MDLKLSMTCGPYDRAQALIGGSVKPKGIELAISVNDDDVDRQLKCQRGMIHTTSMWYRALWEEERALAGADIYPWGFRKTRHEVDKMLGYAHRQGLTPRKYEPEDMFWPSMLET